MHCKKRNATDNLKLKSQSNCVLFLLSWKIHGKIAQLFVNYSTSYQNYLSDNPFKAESNTSGVLFVPCGIFFANSSTYRSSGNFSDASESNYTVNIRLIKKKRHKITSRISKFAMKTWINFQFFHINYYTDKNSKNFFINIFGKSTGNMRLWNLIPHVD